MLLFEKISNKIAYNIAKATNMDKDHEEVIAYGAYIVLDTVLALGMVMLFGAIFGVFYQSLIVSFTSALFRKTSGGAHATTSIMCAIIGTIVAVGFALIIDNLKAFITLPSIVAYIIISFAISYVLTLKYAPKDSPNKPIDKDSKIIELKLKSIRMLHIYFIICIFILALSIYLNNQNLLPYIALICSGHLWQAITLTSLGHYFIYIMELPIRCIKAIGGEKE